MRWSPPALSLVLLVLLLGQGMSLAAEPTEQATDGLISPWPLEGVGSMSMQTRSGAVVSHDQEALTSARLVAERLTFNVEWQRGVQAGGVIGVNQEFGEYPLYAQDAELRFEQWPGRPTLFVAEEEDHMDLRMDTQTGYTILPEFDEYVVGLGRSRNSTTVTGEGPSISYWYQQKGASASAHGSSNLRVEGDFTLVVENTEIHVKEEGDEWTHWTGYHEGDPDDVVNEFEFRLTVIEVENGTLISPHRSKFSLFARNLEGKIDGVLNSPGVTGSLLQKNKAFIFDEDPMEIEGSGRLAVDATTGRRSTLPELQLLPSGDYEVRGASTVETLDVDEKDSWPGTLLSWTIGGLAAAAMTTAGLARLGYLPPATPAAKHRRYHLWLRRGQDAADRRKWSQASWCFRKATRIKGDEPVAWFEWAHSELEAGNHLRADQIATKAGRVPGVDAMDILDLRASAAWERGDREALEVHLTQLAKGDVTIAQGLVHDLGIDTSGFPRELRELLGIQGENEEAGIDGYA